MMNTLCRRSKKSGYSAQAITEFAIVLPILLMMLLGILEVARLIYIYAAVNNASREAVRYASAVGLTDDKLHTKYNYCKGIADMARRAALVRPLTITISYDTGPGTVAYNTCDDDGSGSDPGVFISPGDRVQVTVTATYTPLVKLIPLAPKTITSTSARTILGIINLTSGISSVPGPVSGPSDTPTVTLTSVPNTAIPSDTPTATTAASTLTATDVGPWFTFTPNPTNTPTNTPTSTATATVTFTPTTTATAVPGCSSIQAGSISITTGTPTMSLTITNPHEAITVLDIRVVWNSTNGGPAGKPLALKTVSLGGVFWTGNNSSGDFTISSTTVAIPAIPGNNVTSKLVFTFDNNYHTQNGLEKIVINLATPGCENYPIQRP
ncbi:MAG TPA: TadE family protein [Anaerolineales bacterium]|nr:TadE family protein [Anaerolineales bacterium]HLO33567.1 TadE family protein [Anaerolineales bacterium]